MAAVGPAGKTNLVFNPTSAPHFSHVGEQDVRSVKMALSESTQHQSQVLTGVEGILNAKSLRPTPSSGVDGHAKTSHRQG